ncbi:MAG: hypothetical protein P8099_16745 [Gemmatimonadota bacterium]|jgi:hypothetical protein
MKCADARTELLTAEPAELEGIGASPLAEHIRGCDRCRAAARVILDQQAALAQALVAAARPAHTADQAADAVLAVVVGEDASPGSQKADAPEAGAGGGAGSHVIPLDTARRWAARRVTSWRAWVPVALAAGLTAVLLVARPRQDWHVPAPEGAPAPTQVAVSAPPGKNVVVFGTRNPDIKVIWFYSSKD